MRFIAIDWGTSNRRAYVVEDGRTVEEREDDLGILKVPAGDFAAARRYAGLLFDAYPNDPDARALLQSLADPRGP